MTNNSTIPRMRETDYAALKEALRDQQQLLQKLYNELDVERESSATAASEALSMILRLQGEKAAVKMEAEQYKRLAEEKIHHAEELMAIFEDIMYQKEMEIASLDYQVQAYKFKLLSMGCVDPGVGEIKFPENLLQRNENLVVETSTQSAISRRHSAPPNAVKLSNLKKAIIKRERSSSPDTDSASKIFDKNALLEKGNYQNSNPEKKEDSSSCGEINSYWEQIKKLDERVKGIAGDRAVISRGTSRSFSTFPQENSGAVDCDESSGGISSQADRGRQLSENQSFISDSSCSLSMHDVFEVPQTTASGRGYEKQIKAGIHKKVDSFPREIKSKKKIPLPTKRVCKPSDETSHDCQLSLARPTIVAAQAQTEFLQLNWVSEIEELDGGINSRPESSSGRKEELKLLDEIREQLNSIQHEIRNWKNKEASPSYSLPMLSLVEEMLHFWL